VLKVPLNTKQTNKQYQQNKKSKMVTQDQDQDRCLQEQDQNDKTNTTGSKQRHLAYLTFK